MNEVRQELDRLGGAWARTRGRDVVAKAHITLIGLAVLAALGHRVLGPWPILSALDGHWLLAPAAALLLLFLGPLMARLLPTLFRPGPRQLARRLDDALDWHDAADTALDLSAEETAPPVEAFHATQTHARLGELDPLRLWPARREGVWPVRILAAVFLLLLLLPGVLGLAGERGAGHGTSAGLGTSPEEEPLEPVDADQWLAEHARLILAAPDAVERPLEL
ncbi:MAG: hypothetical protein ACYTG6_17820, partial [Planctomycetota bacterium]